MDGAPIGYCYREESRRPEDSGWCFFAGDESEAYLDDPNHSTIYALNTIANYDAGVILLLDAPAGSAFERQADGAFIPVPWGGEQD